MSKAKKYIPMGKPSWAEPPKDVDGEQPETYSHMLTVLMIMFGDAREAWQEPEKQEALEKEAFEYAESWLEEHDALIHDHTRRSNLEVELDTIHGLFPQDSWTGEKYYSVPSEYIHRRSKELTEQLKSKEVKGE